MSVQTLNNILSIILLNCLMSSCVCAEGAVKNVRIQEEKDRLVIRIGDVEVGHYVIQDKKTPRPYFAHVKTSSGIQVTRNHPPVQGLDRDDHPTMHPGIWMAFGDISGADFWRNKARIEHVEFSNIRSESNVAQFRETKRYVGEKGEICREVFECQFIARKDGHLILWDSTFSADNNFTFGDQEEMGLGVRVATAINELNDGQLRDSKRRVSAREIWSFSSDWCDYSGEIDDQTVGMTIFCHPENFRASWMHARNYGLLLANPFGRKAMQKGEMSSVLVKPGESLRLRYGVFIHQNAGKSAPELDHVYREYLELTRSE